jgi:hypothetical protein
MAAAPSHEEIQRTLASVSIGEFVHIMRLVLEARAGDLQQTYFSSHYALATVHILAASPEPPLVSVVAYAVEPPMQNGLYESGDCPRCGYVGVSTNKLAECGFCGAQIHLT